MRIDLKDGDRVITLVASDILPSIYMKVYIDGRYEGNIFADDVHKSIFKDTQ
ncbi:hypothetical protein KY320_01570 [Candidatus Woesearchaeota archaeon]|nr:hypothetical protein [Candidatus Woesearchaeota archaeon]